MAELESLLSSASSLEMVFLSVIWPTYRIWKFGFDVPLQSPKFNCSVFFSNNILSMSKQCNHSLRNVMTESSVLFQSRFNIKPFPGIGICSKEGCWIEIEFGSNFAFALGLSVSFWEYGTILNSWELGCTVLAESFSSSSGIRDFSVKSLTNFLSPFAILTQDWELCPDKDSILISIPGFPWR